MDITDQSVYGSGSNLHTSVPPHTNAPDNRSIMSKPEPETTHETYTITVDAGATGGIGEILEAIAAVDGTELAIRDVRALDGRTVTVDTDVLTDVQRETLVHAVEEGYYATPRLVDLDCLAEEFDVSKSAISQRLRKAEAAIVRHVVSDIAPGGSEPTDGTR